MNKGGKILAGVAAIAVAACSTQQGKLEIRSTAVPPSAVAKPVPLRVAEGRAQLALGNVALALESFRKAVREDPNSIDALLGVAEAYDRMGRFDLSRRNYESALALAPGDTTLLGALAASLQLQGLNGEAAAVRREIAQRQAVAPPVGAIASTVTISVPKAVEPVTPTPNAQPMPKLAMASPPAPVASQGSVPAPGVKATSAPLPAPLPASAPKTVAVVQAPPPAAPPAVQATKTVAALRAPQPGPRTDKAPAAAPVVVPVKVADSVPAAPVAPVVEPKPSIALPATPAKSAEAAPTALAASAAEPVITESVPAPAPKLSERAGIGRSVTIALPEPVPAPKAPVPEEAPAIPAFIPAREASRLASAEPARREHSEPRIERLSTGVVALITSSRTRWTALEPDAGQGLSEPRFVPVQEANDRSRVRLLNAARVHRLAARTRAYLAGRGWQSMSVGDASSTRQRSVILYPARERVLAVRLSKQFGFPIAMRSGADQVTVLLGHDVARMRAIRV